MSETTDREKELDEELKLLTGFEPTDERWPHVCDRIRELFRERIPVAEVRDRLAEVVCHFTCQADKPCEQCVGEADDWICKFYPAWADDVGKCKSCGYVHEELEDCPGEGDPQPCPECGGSPVSHDGRFACSFCNASGWVEPQPDARAKLDAALDKADWHDDTCAIRFERECDCGGAEDRAAVLDAVEALCVEATKEVLSGEHNLSYVNHEHIACRLVRGKDGDDETT